MPTILACQAGKDVYVEKPLATSIAEGRAMVAAARGYNRVVQVGTHQRSAPHFKDAVDFVKSGELGRIRFVRALFDLKYAGTAAFEYEKDGKDPLPGLAESVGYVRGVLAELTR